MSEINNGGSAFPLPIGTVNLSEPSQSGGMSLRDYFAAKAMASIVICPLPDSVSEADKGLTVAQYVAKKSYAMADAMLTARAGGAA